MKTIWIIDAAYLFNFGKSRPFDYLKLKNQIELANGGPLYESYYLNSSQDPSSDAQAFHTWLKTAPPKGPKFRVQLYKLKTMHMRCPDCGTSFERQVQKGVDVGIATLIMKLAVQNTYDRLILSAGDGDFEEAIDFVKSDLHKEVWMCGSEKNLSPDLQSLADKVLWLEDMGQDIDKY